VVYFYIQKRLRISHEKFFLLYNCFNFRIFYVRAELRFLYTILTSLQIIKQMFITVLLG